MSVYEPVQNIGPEPKPQYDVAQIGPNGHVVNARYRTQPFDNRDHCERCGQKALMACPKCNAPFRGEYIRVHGSYKTPAHCHKCGSEMPWTELNRLAAIAMFADEVTEQHLVTEFKESVGEVCRDTPAAPLAATRLKRLMKKVHESTAKLIHDTIVKIAAETIARSLKP